MEFPISDFRFPIAKRSGALAVAVLALALFGLACGDESNSAVATSSPPTPTVAASGSPGSNKTPTATGPVVRLEQSGASATVTIEIAATTEQRQRGLMFRESLPEDAGMLFLFPFEVHTGFWMRNTNVPLDIAYIGADGRVQEIRAAKPLDETVLTPSDAYLYVLEVNQGWFQRHNLGVGARVTLPEGLPRAQ